MFFKKKTSVTCSSRLLFEILLDDLKDGLCTDIVFFVNQQKHQFGAWGDSGETKTNVIFYLDKNEYCSFEELKEKGTIDGLNLFASNMPVTVTECNGCYPDSTLKLRNL